jgi:two-component system chemotaxis response regulator CheY
MVVLSLKRGQMRMRVLVADDDDLMRTFIVLNLTSLGVRDVVEASNGIQVWSLLKQQDFDLVFLDWYMPGKSGLEILRHLRSEGSQVPVIMVTAEAMREQVLAAIQAGATEYLRKPVEAVTLRNKVARFLGCRLVEQDGVAVPT